MNINTYGTIRHPSVGACDVNGESANDVSFLSTSITSLSSSSLSSSSSSSSSLPSERQEQKNVVDLSDQQQQQVQRQKCVRGVAARTGPLNEAVSRIADVSLEQANELIQIGAVWARLERLTADDLLSQYEDDDGEVDDTGYSPDSRKLSSANSRTLYADLPSRMIGNNNNNNNNDNTDEDMDGSEEESLDDYIDRIESQRYRRILSPSFIEAGTDLRIYPQPRRFPACYEMSRDNNLLYEDTTFIVVDKPPMLPTQPDASNFYECCPACVDDLLGPFVDIQGQTVSHRPLLCHRVDTCVGGCVVLSKDRNGQRVFAQYQRQRLLRKMYLAVTTQPVPLGMHVHWMWAPQSARGKSGGPPCQLLRHTPPETRRKAKQFWTRCVLEVTKCEPIDIDPSKLSPSLSTPEEQQEQQLQQQPTQYYQATVRLVTGRKHQVRAQLASLGCPILYDTLYEPMAGLTLDGLESSEAQMDAAVAACRVPTRPIGLQAHAIMFGGIRAKARAPWWSAP